MNDVCSIELLKSAVTRRLSSDEETALHTHLEHCEACCAQMEQLAGGEAWREEAAALLSADELDATLPELAEWSEVDFSVEHLDPSDDANVLGQLGGYDILSVVGRGGMGVVLKAFDRELKRLVAMKVLAPHLAHSSVARKRFAREAQAAAAVVNPHVIAIHHVQPAGRLPFLIMPLLTGESLAQRLKSRGPLELTEVLRIGMQAAAGLAAAHDQGLVHRDVKPANIFLEKGVERVVITDFGLARAADDVSMTRQGVVAGTPEYMSPEQARGEALDGRSDLFSLGCVLYQMATGVSPFRTDSTIATLRRIVDEQPAAMASVVPELPPWFNHIVDRLLSKDPARRFASASEVEKLLEQCLSHVQQPTSVPLPESVATPAANRSRRSPLVRLQIGVGFVFALILAGILIASELNKGRLNIQSEADDIPIRILQGEEVLKKLTVSQPGTTVRIPAGKYQVEVDGQIDGISVANGTVTLEPRNQEAVKIVRSDGRVSDATGSRVQTSNSNDPGIRVKLRLNGDRHSREMLRNNVGFDGLSLMGSGVRGTIEDGRTFDNIVVVLAHGCRLESFDQTEYDGTKYWDATFFVPQDPTNDGSNLVLSQKRIDQMQEQGVQFWLDHQRDHVSVEQDSAGSTPDKASDGQSVSFHLAEFEPVADLVEHTIPDRDQKVYVAAQPFASDGDVAGARVIDDANGKPSIEIIFWPASVNRIEEATEQHINKPVAIFVNGKLLSAPTMRERFGSAAVITGQFSREEADQIARELNQKRCGKQLGTVLGKPIHERDLNKNTSTRDNLIRLLLQPLIEDYCRKHKLDRAEELQAKFKDEQGRAMARLFVLPVELHRHLFEKHGGRVTLSPFGPVPVDALKTWLEDREKAGEFELNDADLKAAFHEIWMQIPADARFATPDEIKAAFDPALTDRFIESLTKQVELEGKQSSQAFPPVKSIPGGTDDSPRVAQLVQSKPQAEPQDDMADDAQSEARSENGQTEFVIGKVLYSLPFDVPNLDSILSQLPAGKARGTTKQIKCELVKYQVSDARYFPLVGPAQLVQIRFKSIINSDVGREVVYTSNSHLIETQLE